MPDTVYVSIDASKFSPQEAAEWIAEFHAARADDAGAGLGSPLEKQLARLTDYAPVRAPRIQRTHHELVALGYVATLPKSGKDTLPSYISYVDPTTGENLGNLNSSSFMVMRKALSKELDGKPFFTSRGRYAQLELTGDAAIDALLTVASDQLARSDEKEMVR